MNEDAALRAAIEAHVALQHQRVRAANEAGEDLPDSFPFDPAVFEYLYPPSRVPAEVRAVIDQVKPDGVGVYLGQFVADRAHYAVHFDSDGDDSWLCVMSERFELVACACLRVERMRWVSFDELVPYARHHTRHPGLA